MRSFRGIRLVQQTEQKYLRVSLQNKKKETSNCNSRTLWFWKRRLKTNGIYNQKRFTDHLRENNLEDSSHYVFIHRSTARYTHASLQVFENVDKVSKIWSLMQNFMNEIDELSMLCSNQPYACHKGLSFLLQVLFNFLWMIWAVTE